MEQRRSSRPGVMRRTVNPIVRAIIIINVSLLNRLHLAASDMSCRRSSRAPEPKQQSINLFSNQADPDGDTPYSEFSSAELVAAVRTFFYNRSPSWSLDIVILTGGLHFLQQLIF